MAISQSPLTQPAQKHLQTIGERCPWCGQPVPHEKFEEIRSRIEAKERERSAELTQRLREQFARERVQAEAKARGEAKKAAEAALRTTLTQAEQAKQAAEKQLKELKTSHDLVLNRRLREQREALEKTKVAAINLERSKSFQDKQKLEEKLQQLQRQIQNKTADELGEGAEIDLFEELKAQFEDDRIRRVGKGNAGADIIHEVVHNGKICGRIVYDSKNRSAWRHDYVSKLREDQMAAKAEHAILSSHVFPSGTRQLHLQDGVIVANPARALVLAELLRRHIVQTHALRIGNEARAQKTAALYAFVTSERCAQLLDSIETHTDDMLDLDVKEQKAHQTTWERRGKLIRGVQKVRGDLCSEIERIIGTAGAEE